MDRSVLVTFKAEEKEKSEILYKKLHGLTILHPPSSELTKILSTDMFLKSNNEAFIHVTHYLLCLYDADEFKKTFLWPIADRRMEAQFRSSAVDYLNKLNEKHHLKWPTIKLYLFVSPGGMKFIAFMLDFVVFIISELTKRRESALGVEFLNSNAIQLKNLDPRKLANENMMLKKLSSEYLENLDFLIDYYRKSQANINEDIKKMGISAGIDAEKLIDDEYLKALADYNNRLYKEKFSQPIQKMKNIKEALESIEENFTQKKESSSEDEKLAIYIRDLMTRFNKLFPSFREHFEDLRLDGYRSTSNTFNQLLYAVTVLHPNIEENLGRTQQLMKFNMCSEYETDMLVSLQRSLNYLEAEIQRCQQTSQQHSNRSDTKQVYKTPLKNSGINNELMAESVKAKRITSTPILKWSGINPNATGRLALSDGTSQQQNTIAYLDQTMSTMIQQTAFNINATINRSKPFAPTGLHFLRTMHKSKSCRASPLTTPSSSSMLSDSLSGLLQGKMQRQNPVSENSNLNNSLFSNTPLKPTQQSKCLMRKESENGGTPFNANNLTQIPVLPSTKLPIIIVTPTKSLNESKSANSPLLKSAIRKVQNASLNLSNCNISPSGRIDIIRGSHEKSFNNKQYQLHDESKENIENAILLENNEKNSKNNIKKILIHKYDLFDNGDGDVDLKDCDDPDSLFNTSDTILNDVI